VANPFFVYVLKILWEQAKRGEGAHPLFYQMGDFGIDGHLGKPLPYPALIILV